MANALIETARDGNMDFVMSLVELKKVDVNSRECITDRPPAHLGYTALHEASRRGDLEKVRYLLAKGAYFNGLPQEQIETIIQDRLLEPYSAGSSFDYLIDCGNDYEGGFRGTNPIRYTPLSFAVSGNHLEVARLLLASGPGLYQEGTVPVLHRALLTNNYDMVDLILDHCIEDINEQDIGSIDNGGFNHLSTAIFRGNDQSVRCLLDRGADYKKKGHDGHSVLTKGLDRYQKGNYTCIKILLDFIDQEEGRRAVIDYINKPLRIHEFNKTRHNQTAVKLARKAGLNEVICLFSEYVPRVGYHRATNKAT